MKCIAFISTVLSSLICLILQTQNHIFFDFFSVLLFLSGLTVVSLSFDFFKIINYKLEQNEVLKLNFSNDEKSLEIMQYWCNGATYEKIKTDFKLPNDTSVSKELKKAGKFLLREHSTVE